jgi:hypothetical protein
MDQPIQSSGSGFSFVTFLFIVAGAVGLYYLYIALYGSVKYSTTRLITDQVAADTERKGESIPKIPTPYEGGDYTVNLWVYVNSFNKNRNSRKHIFELKGRHFSTLLIGLGAFSNSLVVRTHSNDPSNTTAGGTATGARTGGTPTPNTGTADGNLSASKVDNLFRAMSMDDSLADSAPLCDLPEVDLQRWTMITVVLSGRTIDVYMDGKLARSCTTASFYKVDPTGVDAVITSRGGFDGYISQVSATNVMLTPGDIYKLYLDGPKASMLNIFNWIGSLFTGATRS